MKQPANNWVLLTGGPHSGKSTLHAYLGKQGYAVKPEQARFVLDDYMARGIPAIDIMNNDVVGGRFQEEIAYKEIAEENKCNPNVLTFFDRSCIEYTAFIELRNLTPNQALLSQLATRSYGLAVILESIPMPFDENRLETNLVDPVAESKRQQAALIKAVQATGTALEFLPVMPTQERASQVIAYCNQLGLASEQIA